MPPGYFEPGGMHRNNDGSGLAYPRLHRDS
jgi:hypothetical protein